MASSLATVAILSIGEMGLGIAKLLQTHEYHVITNLSDRSEWTHQRARSASIRLVPTDQELAVEADYILSIVPPRDALSTAKRIVNAVKGSTRKQDTPLYYIDLNAISPRSAGEIDDLFRSTPIRLIDGGIIGGAPTPPTETSPDGYKPSIVVSGPYTLENAPVSGPHLAQILKIKHISPSIGPASGLKMCFASTNKGFTAIAIQAFTTAHKLGVLSELQSHLKEYNPTIGNGAAKALVGMPPKAYRWVREMEEIADTMCEEGGFERDLFKGASEVFRFIAEETELGKEKTGDRKLGKTPGDVAKLAGEGMERRKLKTE